MKIIIIGPMGSGKSTIAELLAQHYQIPYIDLDSLRKEYYTKMEGYHRNDEQQAAMDSNPLALHLYYEPFETKQVEQVLHDYPSGVFDYGGGHSIKNEPYFSTLQRLLRHEKLVFFLTYSKNKEETKQALAQREGSETWANVYRSLNDYFIDSNCNNLLAKYVLYRKQKSREQICKEMIQIIDKVMHLDKTNSLTK